MARQLNADLFQDKLNPSLPAVPLPEVKANAEIKVRSEVTAQPVEHPPPTKKAGSQIPISNPQIDEQYQNTHQKIERLARSVVELRDLYSRFIQDTKSQFSELSGRVTSRSLADAKVKELLDRHNMILRNYEIRLNQLQKILGEKEMLLLNSEAALKEARADLARLKKL